MSCALMEVISVHKDDWDEHVDSILLSYRTSVLASTMYIPCYLMYNRDPVLHIDLKVSCVSKSGIIAYSIDSAELVQTKFFSFNHTRSRGLLVRLHLVLKISA